MLQQHTVFSQESQLAEAKWSMHTHPRFWTSTQEVEEDMAAMEVRKEITYLWVPSAQ
jgi:hypothetical protein